MGRREIGGRAQRAREPADLTRIGARQPRDHRRIRSEGDRVARRQLPVVLGDGQVLVHDPPALVEQVADDLPALDADREGHGAHPVGQLAAEAAEELRLAVGGLVVDGDPAVARRRDDRPLRAFGPPRDELRDRARDSAYVVGLNVDGTKARPRFRRRCEATLELLDLGDESQVPVAEAPRRVGGPRGRIRHVNRERDVRRAHLGQSARPPRRRAPSPRPAASPPAVRRGR